MSPGDSCPIQVAAAAPVLEGKMNCVQCHDPHGMDIMKPAGGPGLGTRRPDMCSMSPGADAALLFPLTKRCARAARLATSPTGPSTRRCFLKPDLNLCLRCHAQAQGPRRVAGSVLHRRQRPHHTHHPWHLLQFPVARHRRRLGYQPSLALLSAAIRSRTKARHKVKRGTRQPTIDLGPHRVIENAFYQGLLAFLAGGRLGADRESRHPAVTSQRSNPGGFSGSRRVSG